MRITRTPYSIVWTSNPGSLDGFVGIEILLGNIYGILGGFRGRCLEEFCRYCNVCSYGFEFYDF